MEKDLKKITLEDIFEDPRFSTCIRMVLNGYYFRPALEKGMRYKRNAFDSLHEKGTISLDNYDNIKKAYLIVTKRIPHNNTFFPFREREAIKYIIETAVKNYYIKYIKDGHKEESGNESSNQQ